MKLKRILCLMLVVFTLACGATVAIGATAAANYPDVKMLDYASDDANDGIVLISDKKADASDAREEDEGPSGTKTAGIIVMIVAGLAIVGGIILKVLQKKKR
jgi:hypothetical protein